MAIKKPVIFSGMQATGEPILGNYIGAIRNWVGLQGDYECLYCIVDLHSLTVRQDPEVLRANARRVLALYIACGLDPEKNIIYFQSHVPAHAELAWILNCFTYVGELNRMTQFKEKSGKNADNINAGLYTYPVLMAADILLFDSDVVPVGKDQVQHVEMAQDIAQAINFNYKKELLRVPQAMIQEEVAVIPGLDGRKMSKSYNNVIPLFENEKQLRKLIMRIVTNSQGVEEIKDPDSSQIFHLYKLFATPAEQEALAGRYRKGGMGWGEAKEELFKVINRELSPLRAKYEKIMAEPRELDEILEAGTKKARAIAAKTLKRLREAVGMDS